MKTLIRAAENKQRGRMRPAGRQFDMPALGDYVFRVLPCNSMVESQVSDF